MRIARVTPKENGILHIVSEGGKTGVFDVRPYLNSEAFRPLNDWHEFSCVTNGGYFIEWKCGADLSADTIEARWQIENREEPQWHAADTRCSRC
ncbi:MAG: DUF2442 domain-containing protein [Spartobacteria bacterium]|nr:DUF2442 domain-containing protein [Spartobacteria bacterium]